MINKELRENNDGDDKNIILWKLNSLHSNIIEQKILTNKEYQEALNKPALSLEREVFNQVMIRRINELRRKENLPALSYDNTIETVAQHFWEELEQNDEWRNNSNPHKDKNGNFVKGRIRRMQLDNYINLNEKVGENIASVWNDSIEKILSRLMNSPWHRAAIMTPKATKFWVSYTDPIVQVFATKNPNYQEPQQPINDTITTPINDTIKKSDQ